MKKTIGIIAVALFIVNTAWAQFTALTYLDNLAITQNTAEKPQSKVWIHDGKQWSVLCDVDGAAVWKLEGKTWKKALALSNKTNRRADCKVIGNVVHILLFHDIETDLISIEYNPTSGTYQLWQSRTEIVRIPCDINSETATIDVDTNGRMWLVSDDNRNITVRWSDSPYKTWSAPLVIATGVFTDDIGAVIAFPMFNKIGIFWSNQITKRFGFKMHTDGADPNVWTADELPASQSALNVGNGLADDHMNFKVASDGTLYCAVKTSYDVPGLPKISLLIRRPSGSWDNLYEVSELGTRAIILLNELTGKIRVVYAASETGGDIYYKESNASPIAFGPQYTLFSAIYNNPTSIKGNFTSEVAIIASNATDAVSVLAEDSGTPLPPPAIPTLNLPVNGATATSIRPTLNWSAATNAATYQIQVSTSPNFSTTILDTTYLISQNIKAPGLAYSTQYYWRVRAQNLAGISNWSATRSFSTKSAAQSLASLAASPNPFRHNTQINFTVPETGKYTLILYNMAGAPVKILKMGNAVAGEELSAETVNLNLQQGLYLVRLQTGKTSQTLKLIFE